MIGARVATVAGPDGSPARVGIVSVTSGGPADRAGLQAGDVIRSLGRTATPDTAALAQALAAAKPGQPVTLAVTRDGQQRTVRLTRGELPGS
jgi:putative serine protease PepD